MRWSDELTLIAVSDEETDDKGFAVEPEEFKTVVFANRKSVGFNEYFKADMAGYNLRMKFDVHSAEYAGQTMAEYEGKRYYILRTYESGNGEYTELTLSELPKGGRNDG